MKSGWRTHRAQARRRDRILQETDFSFMDWPKSGPGGTTSGPGADIPKTQQIRGPVQVVNVDKALRLPAGENEGEGERERGVRSACVSPSCGLSKHLDHLDHLDQASNSAGFPGPSPAHSLGPPGQVYHSWTDDRAWIGDIVRGTTTDVKLATLFSWVIAAGGWISGTTALLPPLPHRLATYELHRILRQFGIAVSDDAGL